MRPTPIFDLPLIRNGTSPFRSVRKRYHRFQPLRRQQIDHMTNIYLLNQEQLSPDGLISPSPFADAALAAIASVATTLQCHPALQRPELSLVQRPFHGVQVLANYTWSKCLSDSLGYFGQYGDEEGVGASQTGGGYFFLQNIYDQKADYGRCMQHVASAFNGYVLYELPFGHGKQFGSETNGWLNQIIGGWRVATAFNVHSGFAINPSAPDQSTTGGGGFAAYSARLCVGCRAARERSLRGPRRKHRASILESSRRHSPVGLNLRELRRWLLPWTRPLNCEHQHHQEFSHHRTLQSCSS